MTICQTWGWLGDEYKTKRFSGEWETKRVSEFGDVVTGATPSTKVDAFWGETVSLDLHLLIFLPLVI